MIQFRNRDELGLPDQGQRRHGLTGMRFRFAGIMTLFAVLALTLTACTGGPTEPNWSDISLMDGNILLTFSTVMLQLDPVDGSQVNLYDANGNVRTDPSTNTARRWEIAASGGSSPTRFYTTPLNVADNLLLAASYDRKLIEIEQDTARVIDINGTAIPGHMVADLLRDGDVLYVPLAEKDLLALTVDGYSQLWRFSTTRGVWATPLLLDGVLYVTSMDHFMYAVNAETGEELWRIDLQGAIASTPLLYNGSLFVGNFARKLFEISLDGVIIAEYDTADWVWGTPVIADDVLYAADLVGNVYALDISGEGFSELWRRQIASRAIRPSPIVYEDRLVVASRDHYVYWLDRETGEVIVRHDVRGEVLAEMLLIEPSETLIIGEPLLLVSTMSRENLLFAFQADGNSEPRWKYPR